MDSVKASKLFWRVGRLDITGGYIDSFSITNVGFTRGKYLDQSSIIVQPFSQSNKHKMRKSFKFDGTQQEKESEISKIKSTIQEDYIHIPHDQWQLGHKNPGSTDNSTNNLILQPPIQAKYKDDYLFFNTLTKMPLPNKLERLLDKKEITLTQDQIEDYMKLFMKLKMNCDETPKTNEQTNERTKTHERTNEQTNEQTKTNEQTNDNENL